MFTHSINHCAKYYHPNTWLSRKAVPGTHDGEMGIHPYSEKTYACCSTHIQSMCQLEGIFVCLSWMLFMPNGFVVHGTAWVVWSCEIHFHYKSLCLGQCFISDHVGWRVAFAKQMIIPIAREPSSYLVASKQKIKAIARLHTRYCRLTRERACFPQGRIRIRLLAYKPARTRTNLRTHISTEDHDAQIILSRKVWKISLTVPSQTKVPSCPQSDCLRPIGFYHETPKLKCEIAESIGLIAKHACLAMNTHSESHGNTNWVWPTEFKSFEATSISAA